MDENQGTVGTGGSTGGDLEPQPSSSTSQTPENVVENSDHPFLKALKFDLVADKLVSLLNFEDMKALSAVSIDCLSAIRGTKEFSDTAKLVIERNIILSGLLKESTYLWKHVSLDLTLPIEVVGLIEDILETAQTLSLKLPSPKDDKEVAQFVGEIFSKTKSLQSLAIDVSIMNRILHDVLSDVAVQSQLGKLDCLIIQGFEVPFNSTCYIDASEDEGETPFQRNFFQLSLLPLNLKKFVFGKICPVSGYSGSESDHAKFIPKIVEATKETLEELALHLKVWTFDEMKGIRCPKLKRLTLSANDGKEAKTVETFLKNQPPLEELFLEINSGIPVSILQTLQGMLSRLKKLHLKTKQFTGTTGPVDWKFLESMEELRDFSIRKPYATDNRNRLQTYGYGDEILSKLPPRTEKISLIGFDPFWRDDALHPAPEHGNNIGVMLERFENLKELNLLRSYGSVTNEGLQSIIQMCPKLVSLAFSHCYDLTGWGLTGILKDVEGIVVQDTGISLKNLQGLTRFKIRSCPNVQPEDISSVAEFQHLRSFDYYRNVDLSKEFLLKIVKQNPCLEQLSLHTRTYNNDDEYVNSLKQEVRGISQRVHKIQILEQSNWEEEDSDSDASSLHEDGDSDFSGGGYDPYDDYDDFDNDSPYDYYNSNSDDDIEF